MNQLTRESRELVLEYYLEEKQAKIDRRKELARRIGNGRKCLENPGTSNPSQPPEMRARMYQTNGSRMKHPPAPETTAFPPSRGDFRRVGH
jgi:hypothetical protein